MTTELFTCHACGEDYQAESIEQDGTVFDICFECRRNARLFYVVVEKDPEGGFYCAGIEHLIERLSDEVYWDYQEYNEDEYRAITLKFGNEGPLDAVYVKLATERARIEAMPIDEIKDLVARHAENLQALWDYGVENGILSVNNQPQPNGPIFRQWPVKFDLAVSEVELADLVEAGVCAA